MRPRLRKVLIILLITVASIHFIGNVLPNLIGVPLAYYDSYKMNQYFKSKDIKTYKVSPKIVIDSIKLEN